MKKTFVNLFTLALVGVMGVSCTTSYDSYGNRRESVSPGGAAVGAIALGALAYSIGKDDGRRKGRRDARDERQFSHNGYEDFRRRGYRSAGSGYDQSYGAGGYGGGHFR